MSGKGFARRITSMNLPRFGPLLRAPRSPSEGVSASKAGDTVDVDEANTSLTPERQKAEALFNGKRFEIKSPFKRTHKNNKGIAKTLPMPVPPHGNLAKGKLLWRIATLPASSVQRQAGNPTGGLRLVQAGFTIGGRVIDQTTYFRHSAFGVLSWRVGKQRPRREDAEADFDVRLLGTDYGTHRLRISHKPSGEAGQNNYTTILHWSSLATLLRTKINLTGRTLEICSPANVGDPFSLVVS
jgi:hypothetical protein